MRTTKRSTRDPILSVLVLFEFSGPWIRKLFLGVYMKEEEKLLRVKYLHDQATSEISERILPKENDQLHDILVFL